LFSSLSKFRINQGAKIGWTVFMLFSILADFFAFLAILQFVFTIFMSRILLPSTKTAILRHCTANNEIGF